MPLHADPEDTVAVIGFVKRDLLDSPVIASSVRHAWHANLPRRQPGGAVHSGVMVARRMTRNDSFKGKPTELSGWSSKSD